jgi:dTDP-4-dehydrorhamnose reductase
MKIAITGSSGLFGHSLVQVFGTEHTVYPLSHAEMDITRAEQVEAVLSRAKPDVVIHAAAIPNPDLCEEDPARAFAVNVHGARNVFLAARRVEARIAYISTDAVFDGMKRSPYTETDPTGPATVYGRTKLLAEEVTRQEHGFWIFRVSVLFGPGKENFVDKGLRLAAARQPYVVAADQLGNATYTVDAAKAIKQIIEAGRYGTYHVANSGCCTRLELARRAAALAGLDPAGITGKPLDQMGRPAKRLPYAVMDCVALKEAGFSPLRPWDEALGEYIAATSAPRSVSLKT